jgi:type II secretory pathway pseudopilin PulG
MSKYELEAIDRLRIADCGLRIVEPQCRETLRSTSRAAPAEAEWRTALPNPQSAIRNPKSSGLSLIEVVASTMIVGLMAVAALNSLGAATRSAESVGNRAVALGLADELMSEILQSSYKDPAQTAVFGPESGEAGGPRSAFDDVDDYDGWNPSPPQYRDGTDMPDREDWRHSVEIALVAPADTSQVVGSDQGAKRIRVVVEYRGEVLAEQIAVRTDTD